MINRHSPFGKGLSASFRVCLLLMVLVVGSASRGVRAATIVVTVTPGSTTFAATVNSLLAGATADDYVVSLGIGSYSGCGATIDMSPGAALSVTIAGVSAAQTTINCQSLVLTGSLFSCDSACVGMMRDFTISAVRMTTASPDNVGAFVYQTTGSSMVLERLVVSSCFVVTHGGSINAQLASTSALLYATGVNAALTVVDSIFSSNTGEVGCISARSSAAVTVTGSSFTSNSAGGGSTSQGVGAVLSLATSNVVLVTNSTFTSSSANKHGGSFYVYGAGSVLEVEHCSSTYSKSGAGSFAYGTNSGSVVLSNTLVNNTISGTIVEVRSSASLTTTNCQFTKFAARAVNAVGPANILMIGTEVIDDAGDLDGYGLSLSTDVTATLRNCTLYGFDGSSGPAVLASTRVTLTLEGCSLSNVTGYNGPIFIYIDSTMTVSNSSVANTDMYHGGFAFVHTRVIVHIEGSSFSNIDCYEGGISFAQDYVTMTVVDCTADPVWSAYNAGLFFVQMDSSVFVSECTLDVLADYVGGMAFIQMQSFISFYDCVLYGGFAYDVGNRIIFVQDVNTVATFSNCVIYRGSDVGDGGVGFVQSRGELFFINCSIIDGQNSRGGVVSVQSDGEVYFYGCSFVNLRLSNEGGIVYAASGGFVLIERSMIHGVTCVSAGIVMALNGVTVVVSDLYVEDVTIDYGGLFVFSNGIDATIDGLVAVRTRLDDYVSYPVQNGGLILLSNNVDLMLLNSVFNSTVDGLIIYSGGIVHSQVGPARVTLSNCSFANAAVTVNGGIVALYSLSGLSSLSVSNCSVTNVSAAEGGFAFLGGPANVTFSNVSPTSLQGGFLMGTDLDSVSITNCDLKQVVGSGPGTYILHMAGANAVLTQVSTAVALGDDSGLVYVESGSLGVHECDLSVASQGTAIVSLFCELTMTNSTVSAVRYSILAVIGSASIVDSHVTSELATAFVSAVTEWTITSSVVVGAGSMSVSAPSQVISSFLGATTWRDPGLLCSASVAFSSDSFSCGSNGALPYPLWDCAGGPVTGTHTTCHDACFSESFCVPSGRLWIDTLGCPLCGGQCWLGTNDCAQNSTYCFDRPGDLYECECRTGYANLTGGSYCSDVDECLSDPCAGREKSVCENTFGSFTCPCLPGYELVGDLCLDVDECAEGLDSCSSEAACVDTAGSFACMCPIGFLWNGTECGACPPFATTLSMVSTECVCQVGYYGELTSQEGCTQCPAFSDTTTAGAPCTCSPGYYGVPIETGCTLCPAHSFSARGALTVDDCLCEPFHFPEPGGNGSCGVCPAGSVVGPPSVCTECAVNWYSVGTNSSSTCQPCPSGSSTNGQRGSTSCSCRTYFDAVGEGDSLVCTRSCPPGFMMSGTTCIMCGTGAYSSSINSPTCTQCPRGSTTSVLNATSSAECFCYPERLNRNGACVLDCPVGSEYVMALDACVPCSGDTYWNSSGSCVSCPPNSYSLSNVPALNISACLCEDGFAFDPVRGWCALYCAPGFSIKSTTSCELCGPGTYTNEPNTIGCLECPANAVTEPGATTLDACTCRVDYYRSPLTGECKECPQGARCVGGEAAPTAEEGYYEADPGLFVECSPAESCDANNACKTGYSGPFCAGCEEGFYRVDGYCRKCAASKTVTAALALGLLLLFSMVLVVYNLGSAFKGAHEETLEASFGGFLIALNSFQVIAMFGQLEIEWPGFVRSLLSSLSIFVFDFELVGVECFGTLGQGGGSTHPFVVRWVVGLLIPLYVAGGLVITNGVLLVLHKTSGCLPSIRGFKGSDLAERLRASSRVSFIQVLLVLYFPLTVTVFEAFQCVDNGTGTTVVGSSRDIPCTGSPYSALLGLGLAGLLVYVIGVPVFLVSFLVWSKRNTSEAVFALRHDSLVAKYKVKSYWYEGAILGRKAAVAAVLLLLTPSPYVRAAGGSFVLLVAFVLNRMVSPYVLRWHNWIECSSLLSTIVFLEVGVAMQGNEWSKTAKVVVATVSLLISLVIILGAAALEVWTVQRHWWGIAATTDVGELALSVGVKSHYVEATEVASVDEGDLVGLGSGSTVASVAISVSAPPPLPSFTSRDNSTYGESVLMSPSVPSRDPSSYFVSGMATFVPPPPALALNDLPPPPPLAEYPSSLCMSPNGTEWYETPTPASSDVATTGNFVSLPPPPPVVP